MCIPGLPILKFAKFAVSTLLRMLHAKVCLWLIHSPTHQVSESINSSPQANELTLVLDTSLSHDCDIKYTCTCYTVNCLLSKYFGQPSLYKN